MTAEEMLVRMGGLEKELAKHVEAWKEVIKSNEDEYEAAPAASFARKMADEMVESGQKVLEGK